MCLVCRSFIVVPLLLLSLHVLFSSSPLLAQSITTANTQSTTGISIILTSALSVPPNESTIDPSSLVSQSSTTSAGVSTIPLTTASDLNTSSSATVIPLSSSIVADSTAASALFTTTTTGAIATESSTTRTSFVGSILTTTSASSTFATSTTMSNQNIPLATAAAGLPYGVPFDGFVVVIKPMFRVSMSAAASNTTNETVLESFLTKELVQYLTANPSAPAYVLPVGFNAVLYRYKLAQSIRLDLALHLNMPAGDIGIDAIVSYLGDPSGQSIAVRFRVSQVRGNAILSGLNASAGGVTWMSSTMSVLQDATDNAINVSLTLSAAGIVSAQVDGVAVAGAAPDSSVTTTPAPPPPPVNAACFVSGGDCPGTIIVVTSLVLFVIGVAVSIKIFWNMRKTIASQRALDAQFEKEVAARNQVREKVVQGQQELEHEALAREIAERDRATRSTAERRQQQTEMEMEIIRQQQHQQQQPAQHHTQTQRFHSPQYQYDRQGNPALQDGLLGTNTRSHQYAVGGAATQGDPLAQTAPTSTIARQQQQQQQQTFNYDDLL